MEAADLAAHDGSRLVIYKNNSDGKGNSYGAHENYLMDRAAPFTRIVAGVTPHFVTRQIFAGAGKVGAETATHDGRRVDFQLSQRAEFFEEQVGLETTLKRPIVNTRDEPHADPHRYRRLHVIVGDANLAEVATFLKVGTTSLVLAMIEDDVSGSRSLALADPVTGHARRGPGPHLHPAAADGRRLDGHRAGHPVGAVLPGPQVRRRPRASTAWGTRRSGSRSCDRWEAVLHGLETDPMSLARQLDWVAKLQLIEAYRDRHGCEWDDHRLAALDLQYHDLRPSRSLFARLDTERLVDEASVVGRGHRAAPGDPGLVPGRVPQEVARRGGHRQLGLAGVRPRHRPAPARPYDGSPEGHGRTRRGVCWTSCASPSELLDRLSS